MDKRGEARGKITTYHQFLDPPLLRLDRANDEPDNEGRRILPAIIIINNGSGVTSVLSAQFQKQ